jgi:hypothetical protein
MLNSEILFLLKYSSFFVFCFLYDGVLLEIFDNKPSIPPHCIGPFMILI